MKKEVRRELWKSEEQRRDEQLLLSAGDKCKEINSYLKSNGDMAFGRGMRMYKCNGMGMRLLTFRQMLSGLNEMAESFSSPSEILKV